MLDKDVDVGGRQEEAEVVAESARQPLEQRYSFLLRKGESQAQDVLDKNKFGQKMLEKMGWSEGKGLGANEDGIKEHVRASGKVEKTGSYRLLLPFLEDISL